MRLSSKLLGQFRALDQRPAPFARGIITQEDIAVARHALTYVISPPYAGRFKSDGIFTWSPL
jgi:hypothetical protein